MRQNTEPQYPDNMPEEARGYMEVVRGHEAEPFVKQYFRQIAWLRVGASADSLNDLFLIEFRDRLNTAFVWQDEHGGWGAGPWIQVAHLDADVLCKPSQFSLNYFRGAEAHATFAAAMGNLAATRPK
jgi:hypothetical protein